MRLCLDMGWYKAKSIEDFEMDYIWWLGHFADRLQEGYGVSLDKLFTIINGAESETKTTIHDFLFGCFKGGEEAEHCADRIFAEGVSKQSSIGVDGQAREKGIGNG